MRNGCLSPEYPNAHHPEVGLGNYIRKTGQIFLILNANKGGVYDDKLQNLLGNQGDTIYGRYITFKA